MTTAHLSGFIFYTWRNPETGQTGERTEMLENTEVVGGLRTTGPGATVTEKISTKISDSLAWGDGNWDKIPYSVEISASVSLEADQNDASILRAQNMAHDLAWKSTRRHLGVSVVKHCTYIQKKLYPELFGERD